MRHEKEFKRDDKSVVRITVEMRSMQSSVVEWSVECAVRGYRKQNWTTVAYEDDYGYRNLQSRQDRKAYVLAKVLEHATEREVMETALELWEKVKPTCESLGINGLNVEVNP